ncbi:MAG: F0F1 ATP synthase subunit A [Deltaproteobacteria bacterium]|nr:F0F1 ATP synthase subunit A [Deltaproteobacteria bacterium]
MKKNLLISLGSLFGSSVAFASEGGGGVAHFINYYSILLHRLHIDHAWEPTVGGLLCLLAIIVAGIYYRRSVSRDGANVVPSGKFSLRHLIEEMLEFVVGIAKDNTHERYLSFFPFLAAVFVYIVVCNLSGLIPGFPPPTETMDNNVAVGICVFVVYNLAGIKEHGGAYVKHFLGPVAFIAPLFFCIELVSHFSRPLSLGLRLTGNIYGDHTLLGVFTSLSYLVFPALLMFFGLLVAVVQSVVFTLLSGIYISMAISHDH